jgi:hypothetical protein
MSPALVARRTFCAQAGGAAPGPGQQPAISQRWLCIHVVLQSGTARHRGPLGILIDSIGPPAAPGHAALGPALTRPHPHEPSHPQHADAPPRDLRADRPGHVRHVRVRHHGLRPVPHGAPAHDDGLRRGLPLAARQRLAVTYVRNITDIDDKIIRRALERGMSIRALTDEMIAAMHRDIGAIGVLKPDARAARHRLRAADARHDRPAGSQGPGLPARAKAT